MIAVTAKCMLRRERQDMGVGDAEIVSILCKAHTADVRVRLAITYFTLCCAWAIYTVTDLSAYIHQMAFGHELHAKPGGV